MLDKFKKIYTFLPGSSFKFLKYAPDSILFGRSYTRYRNEVSFNKNVISTNLFNTLVYARENTRYGSEHIPKGLVIEDVFEVLNDLPIITSKDLSDNLDYFKSREYNYRNSYKTTTGGTGRNPTTVLLSNDSFGVEWAHMHHIWKEAGYKRRQVKLTLRGNIVKGDKLFDFNPIYNEYVVNAYRINKDNFHVYRDLINRKGIEFIHGYPSLVKEFHNYMRENMHKIKMKGLFLGSEGISTDDKAMLKTAFDAKVISWYGQTEKVVLAQDFDCNNVFKVFTSYGYPCIHNADENNFGEILGTTFVNKALPLIKYATGDFGSIVEKDDFLYLENIKGRWGKDFVYLSKDKRISTTAINLHSAIQTQILFYQIYQKEYGVLEIKILPKKNLKYSEKEMLNLFKSDIQAKLADFSIHFKIAKGSDEIVRSARGKMIMLVQELK